eukprot:gene9494-1707_t
MAVAMPLGKAEGATEDQDPAAPVAALLARVVGDVAGAFNLHVDPAMPQGFKMNSSASKPVVVTVTASGLPELAYGAGYYLRTYAHMSFSWDRTGGNNVRVPSGGLPPVPEPVAVRKKAKWHPSAAAAQRASVPARVPLLTLWLCCRWSYYQNVCTQSYSMWWWDWQRWQREIDWAALWGVNLVLAYTGQEHVFRQVFNSIGVPDSMLNVTFDGPAFLTWSRGQGTFGYGGPLPNYWIESQARLQVQIMDRLRQLGMNGVVPGFQGNVPHDLKQIFPNANTSDGWLDGLDPLFRRIGHGVAQLRRHCPFITTTQGIQQQFGPSDFIEADGWFALETGPWLSTSPAGHSGSADSDSGLIATGTGDADGPELGCFNGFNIPSEEEAYARASSIFNTLTSASPDAVWVYQGYPWFRIYSMGDCNQTALRLFVKGFTRAIPKDKLLVLDLVADSPGRAIWKYPASPELGPFAQNASLVWCALNNWGGAVHIGGDLSCSFGDLTYVLNETRNAMATTAVSGVGLTPEGIDNSPAYFSLVLDSAWTTQPTAEAWLQEWGASRCGSPSVPAAQKAYELLFQTVYRPGKPYLWCCSQPRFCPTVYPTEGVDRPDYNVSLLRQALELMVEAAPDCDTSTFRYDLVDVAREWLSMAPCLQAYDAATAAAKGPAEDLRAKVAALTEVTNDVDDMMATDPGFLLGAWLKSSRNVSAWDGSGGSLADFYEYNSRLQITTWAGGYSRREWSGMVKSYYGGRTAVWLNYTLGPKQARAVYDIFRVAGDYFPVQGYDCNFEDLANHKQACEGKDQVECIAILEGICNQTSSCIGFNYPGCILKKGCNGWEVSEGSTMYFRDQPRSKCSGGSCLVGPYSGAGSYNGTECMGHCPHAPPGPHKSLSDLLSAFADDWVHDTWSEEQFPSTPVGDPVAVAKTMLAKYPE